MLPKDYINKLTKTRIISLLVITTMLLSAIISFPIKANAATSGDYEYEVYEGEVLIVAYIGTETEVTIPSTIEGYPVCYIEPYAFKDSTSLTSISVDSNNPNYSSENGVLFNKDKTSLIYYPPAKTDSSYTVPNSVIYIDNISLSECMSLNNISVDSANPYFSSENGVLYNKDKTELIIYPPAKTGPYIIPDSVTGVYTNYAFNKCTSLTSVTIPNNVQYLNGIVADLFNGCTSLTNISVYSNNPNYSSENGVLFNKDKTTLIYCPPGKAGSYTVPDGVINVRWKSFLGCISLTNVTIPETVAVMGYEGVVGGEGTSKSDRVFGGCTSLVNIFVDEDNSIYSDIDGVMTDKAETTIFQYPIGRVGSYTIPNSITEIGNYSFELSPFLTEIIISDNVENVGISAFGGCASLADLSIGSGVETLGTFAFIGCNSLTDITIPSNVTRVVGFEGCSSLANVTILNDVATVGGFSKLYSPNLMLWCNYNSTTHRYAVTHQIPFTLLDTVKYTVIFDSMGGSSVSPLTDIAKNSKISKPYSPTRSGFTFVSWCKDQACTQPWNFDTDVVTNNTTLFAKWDAISAPPPAPKYTGWQKINGHWYLYSSDGAKLTGWQESSGKWYFMNSAGIMQTGWLKSGGKWYHLKSSGIMSTGWLKSGKKWYHLKSSGVMSTGWLKSGKKWYYFKSSGVMVTGNHKIGKKTYRFNSSGVWI